MIKHKGLQRLFGTNTLIILGLIVGIWISGCTKVMVRFSNDKLLDGGNVGDLPVRNNDIEEARDVRRQEADLLIDSAVTVDVKGNDLGNKDTGIKDAATKDVGLNDLGRKDIGNKDAGLGNGTWVTIPAGVFYMGSPAGEACRYSNETQHRVTLTRSFEIQTTEVTQGQFQTLMGYNPSFLQSCGSTCPVEQVNWHEAAAYCNALSAQGGYAKCYDCTGSGTSVTCAENGSYTGGNIYNCPGYRLPTEAEWEYAYRAGTATSLHNNTDVINCYANDENANAVSWNMYNSSSTTHPVGGKPANSWGLYDMAGNVLEWCNDWWDGATAYGATSVTDPWGQSSADYKIMALREFVWVFEADRKSAESVIECPA